MSQVNVVEILRRKSDGALFEVLYVTRQQAVSIGHRFLRMGPAGEPRSKRKWFVIKKVFTEYELAQTADAVDPHLQSEGTPSTRDKTS